jgi:hypothetical protein
MPHHALPQPARTYSARVMTRARELRKAGWGYQEIVRILQRELGVCPSWKTVERWCIPDGLADQRRSQQRKWSAEKRASADRRFRDTSPEWELARMRELNEAGLSHFAIAQVARVWWGETIGEDTVARRLRRKSAAKAYRRRSLERREQT